MEHHVCNGARDGLTRSSLMQAGSPPWTLPGQPSNPSFSFAKWVQELEGRVPTHNYVLGMRSE